jgi:predicted nucleic acid-binding protein
MASKALQVKVPTTKVIAALTKKLAHVKKAKASEATHEAAYQKEYKAWEKKVQAYAIKNISKATNFRTNYREWQNTMNIDYDVPIAKGTMNSPDRNFESIPDYQYKEIVEEITNALNILHMTEEEYVNASTMKSISKYL